MTATKLYIPLVYKSGCNTFSPPCQEP